MAAILDMQISSFFRAIHQRAVLKYNLRGSDEYWRLLSVWKNVVLEYANQPMVAILNMQFS